MTKAKETLPPKPTSHEGALGMLREMQCSDGAFGTCMMCGGVVADKNSLDELPVHKPGCTLKAALEAGPRFDLELFIEQWESISTRIWGRGPRRNSIYDEILACNTNILVGRDLGNTYVAVILAALDGLTRADYPPSEVSSRLVKALGQRAGSLYGARPHNS